MNPPHDAEMPPEGGSSVRLRAEWEAPQALVLVYPGGLRSLHRRNPTRLAGFCGRLLNTVLSESDVPQVLLLASPAGLRKAAALAGRRFTVQKCPPVQSIWVRDFGPVGVTGHTAWKAWFSPSYYDAGEKRSAEKDDAAGERVAGELYLNVRRLETPGGDRIVLDGGNFIHNGAGVAIVSNRIIADNESVSVEELEEVFRHSMGIRKLIIVPVEPGDDTGHVDGMLRFIDESTLAVASYPAQPDGRPHLITEHDLTAGRAFLDRLAGFLGRQFPGNVVRIPHAVPESITTDGMGSAVGCYLNWLRLGQVIFLPQFEGLTEQNALAARRLEEVIPAGTRIVKVPVPNELPRLGGVINCISWVWY
ncbi:MAG: agmatine deiminase family protein [Bacteroidota bacterium]